MAERVVFKGGDQDGTVLDNAASEATLLLLAENMGKWAKSQGLSSNKASDRLRDLASRTSSATNELEDFEDQLEDTGSALGSVADFAGKASKALLSLGGNILKAGGNLTAWSTGIIQNRPVITDFTGAIEDSRLNVFGMGTALNAVTGLLYSNFKTFEDLSKSGIALGDRVTNLSREFTGLGVRLDTITSSLSDNSENFAVLGTASRGASMALAANSMAFEQNSQVLRTFGLNFDEQAERFSRFFGRNALALQRGTVTQGQLVASSLEYEKMVRRLSELTGKQADEIDQGMAQANLNKGFQRFMSGLDSETQQRFGSILNTMQAGFGEAGREAAMASILGIAPVTDEARALTAVLPGFGDAVESLTQKGKNFSGSLEDFNSTMLKELNTFANQNQGFADSMSRTAGILTLQGSSTGFAMGNAINGINLFSGSISEVTTKFGKIDPVADLMLTFDQTVQKLRDLLNNVLISFLEQPSVQEGMTKFSDFVKNFDPSKYNIFDEAGRKQLIDDAKGVFKTVGDIMSATVSSAFDTLGMKEFDPMTPEGRENVVQYFKNLAKDIFLGKEIEYREGPELYTERRGGLFDAIARGIEALFNDQGIIDSFKTGAQTAFKAGSDAILDFWNSDESTRLRDTISGYFQELIYKMEDTFVNSWLARTFLGIDREEVARRQAERNGLVTEESAQNFARAIEEIFDRNATTLMLPIIGGFGGIGQGSTSEMMQSFTPEQRKMIDQYRPSGWQQFLSGSYTSEAKQIEQAFNNIADKAKSGELTDREMIMLREMFESLKGYRSGTKGFENFGDGQLAILHGLEAVVPMMSPMGKAMQFLMNSNLMNGRLSDIKNINTDMIRSTRSQSSESEISSGIDEIKNTIVNALTDNADQKTSKDSLDQLNNTMKDMLIVLTQINDNSKKHVKATQTMSGNVNRGI